MSLLLLLFWICAVNSASLMVDQPDSCFLTDDITSDKLSYACAITRETMATVLTIIKRSNIEVLLLDIRTDLANFVFDENSFSKDLEVLSIISAFPFYIAPEAFKTSGRLNFLHIELAAGLTELKQIRSYNTTVIKKNVILTSPTFGAGWLTPITGLLHLNLTSGNYTSFRSEEFCELQDLQELDLSSNIIQSMEGLGITCNSSERSCFPCLPHVTDLRVSNNPIKTLNVNIAKNLPHLINLDISHCLLSHVNLSLLLSSNLEKLEINNNTLQSLDMDCQRFRNVSFLTVLLLQNNQLQTLATGIFGCIQQLQHLDLSRNLLTEDILMHAGLNLLTDLNLLDLSYNKIASLPPTLVGGLTELKEFYCSECRLVMIANDTFSQLKKLEILKLDGNTLHVIESGALLHLMNLHILNLTRNYLSDITFIGNFPSLKELFLGYNNLLEIPDFSSSSWNLSTLILDRNNISEVHTQHLSGLTELKIISLGHNNIQHIQDYAFQYLPKLNELVLNDNKIKTFEHYGLGKMPYLIELRLDNNLLTVIPLIKFLNLQFLTTVNLSRNLIKSFDLDVPNNSLQLIDISQNHISKMVVRMAGLTKLRILDLGYNDIQVLDGQYFGITFRPRAKVFLQGNPLHCDCEVEWLLDTKLDLTLNQILRRKGLTNTSSVPKAINYLVEFEEISYVQIADLDLIQCGIPAVNGGRFLSALDHDDFTCTYDFVCFKDLCRPNCCRQGNCSCRSFCKPECTCYTTSDNSVNNMNCSFRYISVLPPSLPPQGLRFVKSLRFDGNNISSLNSFNLNFPELETLYINKSHVSHLEAGAFSNLTMLRILDLRQNQIENIITDAFIYMGRLEELYLQENKVQFIESDSFSDVAGLKVLELHKNKLKYVNLTVFDKLDSLTKLTLHDNPWVCDCQFGPVFQRWLVSNAKVVSISTDIYCMNYVQFKGQSSQHDSFPKESIDTLFQPVLNIDFSICSNLTFLTHTHIEYRHSKPVVETISLSLAFTILICVLFVFHKNRLLLRVWMYNKYGLCIYTEYDDDKEYDVFIAYSKEDDILVANELLPELEQGQFSYKVCLEGRDWPVGPPTADMTIAAIQKSKRTILLVSPNYFNTQWCEYSFDAGLYQVLSDKQIRLLIILTDKDLQPRMTPSMKLYLKMNPFLVIGEKWFWRKLRYYLPHNPLGADEDAGRGFIPLEVY